MAWGLLGVGAAIGGSVVDLRPLQFFGWLTITIVLGSEYFVRTR